MKKPYVKKLSILPATLIIVTLGSAALAAELKTDTEKFSYSVGFQIGQSLKRDGVTPDIKLLTQAIQDVVDDKKPALTSEQMREAVTKFQQKQTAERNERAKVAKVDGEKYLTANKAKPGVKALENGLQYKILTEGKGVKPAATDTIVAHYKGTLINGKTFDSSYDRNEPATFGVSNVIKGWQEIIPMMPVGSKWQVYIPSELAYGERGAGGSIGPNETLIFDIELLEIKKPEIKQPEMVMPEMAAPEKKK